MNADSGRAERRTALALFVFFCSIFLLGAQPGVFNADAEVEFQTARSLLLRGHAGLSDAHPDASSAEIGIVNFVPGPGRKGFDVMRGRDGHYYSWFGIGHAIVMLPFVAAGRGLAALFPETQERALERAVEDAAGVGASEAFARAFGEDFFAHALVGLHSALFAAGIALLLFVLLGHLGFGVRVRVFATVLACLTTQLWPGARECMSDVTANFFFLLAVERVLAWARSGAGRVSLLVAGAAGGFSVLCRYGQLIPLVALGVYLAFVALLRAPARVTNARERVLAISAFALAALPFGVALLAFNYHRFGSVWTTGYEVGTADGYWDFPIHLGVLFLLFSPGKGACIFSPVLLSVLGLRGRVLRERRAEVVLAVVLFVAPCVLAARMTGWHASQSWAVRYMTLGTVLVAAIAVAAIFEKRSSSPWLRRAVLALAALGFVINLGGIATSYRGYYDLGQKAWSERWRDLDPREDLFQRAVLTPRLSPAIGHWLYAFETARGRLPAGDAATPGERAAVWDRVYGVVPKADDGVAHPQVLQFVEDRDFGHLWWTTWGRRFGSAWPGIAAVFLALLALLAGGAVLRDPSPPSRKALQS